MKYIYPNLLLLPTHRCEQFILWYWCNIHIQLLSLKIRCLSQRFQTTIVLEFKFTAASWNVTLSYLFFVIAVPTWSTCACILCHFKQEICLVEELVCLAYTTGTTSKHQRFTWPGLYRKLIVFPHIVVWHISVHSLARGYVIRVWLGSCDVL